MKTWKDATIKRELERLAEGLQEVDKTIISYVRISMGNLSDTRTVTVYTDFAKDEWLFKVTFNFEVNTMTVECGRLEPYTKKISSLKSSVNYCLESFNASFDEFEAYYGMPYEHYLPTTEAEEVAEETAEEPKAEDSKVEAVAQYLAQKITGWYENARVDYGVSGKFISCKEYGDNGIRINWEEDGKEYTMVINYYNDYSFEQLYNIWMAQDVEVKEVKPEPNKITDVKAFFDKLVRSFDDAGFGTSCKQLSKSEYSIHAISSPNGEVTITLNLNTGYLWHSADVTVYSGTGCTVINHPVGQSEEDFIKAVTEEVVMLAEKEKKTMQAKTYADDKVQEIRNELTKLEELEEATNVIDAEWEKDAENTELEKKWDEAYKKEYQQFKKVYGLVANLVGIDLSTARQIVSGNRDQLKKILGL